MTKQKALFIHIFCQLFALITCIIGSGLLIYFPILGFRYQLILIIWVILFLLLALNALYFKKRKKKPLIALWIITFLYGGVITYCDYIFYRAVSTVSSISSQEGDIITSDIYVLKDSTFQDIESLKNEKIAIQPSSNFATHTIVIEGLKNDYGYNDTTLKTEIYANYVEAYESLLRGDSSAIALDESGIAIIEQVHPSCLDQLKKIVTFQQISEEKNDSSVSQLSTEPFTILINGVDIRNGNLNQAANADVIMLATFNPETMKLSLNSIPRDTYLPITCRGQKDKITHSGSGGVNCTIKSIENAFDINIDYYVKLNFYAVVDLVDAIGGIDVDVPITFTEQDSHDSPDAIHLEAGPNQHLNGEQALALARHRKTLLRGDIDRGIHQQIVIEGILKKLASGKIVTSVDSLLKVVDKNVQTNMSPNNMYDLFSLLTQLGSTSKFGDLSSLNIQSHTIEGHDMYRQESWSGGKEIYYFVPNESSIKKTKTEINRIIGKEKYPLPTSKFSFNANVPYDNADIDLEELVYMEGTQTSRKLTFPDFTGKTQAQVKKWCTNNQNTFGREYKLRFEYRTIDGTELTSDSIFDSATIEAGEVLSKDNLIKGTKTIIIRFKGNTPATKGLVIHTNDISVRHSNESKDLLSLLSYYVTDYTGTRVASSTYTISADSSNVKWNRAGTYQATVSVVDKTHPDLQENKTIQVKIY